MLPNLAMVLQRGGRFLQRCLWKIKSEIFSIKGEMFEKECCFYIKKDSVSIRLIFFV